MNALLSRLQTLSCCRWPVPLTQGGFSSEGFTVILGAKGKSHPRGTCISSACMGSCAAEAAVVFSHHCRHKIMTHFTGPSNQNCVYLNCSVFLLVDFTKYTLISEAYKCKQIVPVYFLSEYSTSYHC